MTGLVLSLAALVGALVLTAGVGLPLLGRATKVRRWRTAQVDASGKSSFAANIGFDPLDLGEDPLVWPSEQPERRREIDIPRLEWPSVGWDDPYFGINKTFDPSQLAQAPPSTLRERQSAPRPQRRQRQQQPSSQGGAVRAAAQVASRAVEESFFEPARQVRESASKIPSQAEVKRLVEQHGLASAVQHIRDRTGWDFKRAAQFLAETMRQ